MRARTAAQVDLRFALASLPEPTACDSDPRFTSDDPLVRAVAAKLCTDCPVFGLCQEAGRGETAGVWGGVDHGPVPEQRKDLATRRFCTECGRPLSGRRRVVCSDECFAARYRRPPEERQEGQTVMTKTQTHARALVAALDNDMAAFVALLNEADVNPRHLAWSLARALARELEAKEPRIRLVVSEYLLAKAAEEVS